MSLKADYHTHPNIVKEFDVAEAFIQKAIDLKFDRIGINDHCPIPGYHLQRDKNHEEANAIWTIHNWPRNMGFDRNHDWTGSRLSSDYEQYVLDAEQIQVRLRNRLVHLFLRSMDWISTRRMRTPSLMSFSRLPFRLPSPVSLT